MPDPLFCGRPCRRRAGRLAAALLLVVPLSADALAPADAGPVPAAVDPAPTPAPASAAAPAPPAPVAPVDAAPDERALPDPRAVAAPDAHPATPAPHVVPDRDRSEVVTKTIVALLALVALAYLGGHPRVRALEERLRISQVITAGLPFVVLGVVARHPAVGIVTAPVLAQMDTLLGIALGWLGLVAGFRFDARLFAGLPSGAARAVAIATSVPFAFVAGLTGIALLSLAGGFGDTALRAPTLVRDALLLGTAGAMTAKTSTRLLGTAESARSLASVIRVEELAGVLGLAIIAAFFRPHADVTWQLPGTAWLLLTVGLGATVGIVTYAMYEAAAHARPEFVVLTLGSVSFAAGVAGYLHLSPMVVTFVAGVLLANFPGTFQARLGAALRRLERPVHLLALFAIGALWDVHDWRGWLLMPVFMATRLIGKRVGANLAGRRGALPLSSEEREALAVSPMGPLAIAIVASAQLLYPGGSVSLIASAVVGGAILTEVVVQLVSHGKLSTLERRARGDAGRDGSREAIG